MFWYKYARMGKKTVAGDSGLRDIAVKFGILRNGREYSQAYSQAYCTAYRTLADLSYCGAHITLTLPEFSGEMPYCFS